MRPSHQSHSQKYNVHELDHVAVTMCHVVVVRFALLLDSHGSCRNAQIRLIERKIQNPNRIDALELKIPCTFESLFTNWCRSIKKHPIPKRVLTHILYFNDDMLTSTRHTVNVKDDVTILRSGSRCSFWRYSKSSTTSIPSKSAFKKSIRIALFFSVPNSHLNPKSV